MAEIAKQATDGALSLQVPEHYQVPSKDRFALSKRLEFRLRKMWAVAGFNHASERGVENLLKRIKIAQFENGTEAPNLSGSILTAVNSHLFTSADNNSAL